MVKPSGSCAVFSRRLLGLQSLQGRRGRHLLLERVHARLEVRVLAGLDQVVVEGGVRLRDARLEERRRDRRSGVARDDRHRRVALGDAVLVVLGLFPPHERADLVLVGVPDVEAAPDDAAEDREDHREDHPARDAALAAIAVVALAAPAVGVHPR
jgi:hypothetical protein